MKCPNGHENPEGVEFCLECGLEINPDYTNQDELKDDKSQSHPDNSQKEEPYNLANNKSKDDIKNAPSINAIKVSLLNNNEEIVKTWVLSKFPSYSVGKVSNKGGVDIDLSNFEGGNLVSRIHGKFYKKDTGWVFVDVGSKNGSELFNGNTREQLVSNKEYPVKPNDVIVLAGQIKLLISEA